MQTREDVQAVVEVLADQGYDRDAIDAWLRSSNPALPGQAAPVDLLPTHLGRVLELAGSARPCGRP
ncbi:Rv2175c family DNA-binding protein [Nocardioides sp. SYSU DS0663]|uniref:Rv2175c family DNA-binding protein n=1 Tax=Nocardioides sp. SYSU DS0663 TaxID=3416445 RepID=UPI003F4C5B8A